MIKTLDVIHQSDRPSLTYEDEVGQILNSSPNNPPLPDGREDARNIFLLGKKLFFVKIMP